MRVLLGCLMLVGCEPTAAIDSPDASSPPSDAPVVEHGLMVSLIAAPALPGPVRPELNVTFATFKLDRLQAIGDAGGDQVNNVELTWDGSESAPAPFMLDQAPTGIYSKVTLDIDAGVADYSYEIRGTCKVSGAIRDFEIHDRNSLRIQINGFDRTLQPGMDVTLLVKLDLKDALGQIDFGNLDTESGTLVLGNNDSQMSDFRDRLRFAFKRGN